MSAALPFLSLLLVQWTLLLALGWGVHAMVRQRHPRWRLLLWRSVLAIGLVLPALALLPLPRVGVPMPRLAVGAPSPSSPASRESASVANSPAPTGVSSSAPRSSLAGSAAPGASGARSASALSDGAGSSSPGATSSLGSPVSWRRALVLLWLAGGAWAGFRLLRLHGQLRGVVRRTSPAAPALQAAARAVQAELHISRPIAVRISHDVASPCLCGMLHPAILLPAAMAEALPPDELHALLSHELAHQRRHDLAWCAGWRLMQAVWWFHPLVWRVPGTHVLACEEEADRVAASRPGEGRDYAQLLARLALRVVGGPFAAGGLALSATSHLAQRLRRLAGGGPGDWRCTDSLAGLAAALGLLVLTAGWQFAQEAAVAAPAPNIATATVVVTVQDEEGRPIEGAMLTPDGLRTAPNTAGHFSWVPERHGPAVKTATDREGRAIITYPVMVVPEEKMMTGELSFRVEHPDFAAGRPLNFKVDGTAPPVRLKHGLAIRVSGYYGPQREPVRDLVPVLIGPPRSTESPTWKPNADRSLSWFGMTPGKHYLFLAGRRASGEIVYSEGQAFFTGQKATHDYSLEMKPGVRVEGRLAASAPRPVKNGWVELAVHDSEANTAEQRTWVAGGDNTGIWYTYRPIAEDGTFVFESVPAGELKVVARGDGFVSVNGPNLSRPAANAPPEDRSIPLSFPSVQPVTTLEIPTIATATVKVVVKHDGAPVAGARVYVWPNVAQMPNGSRVFGTHSGARDAPFITLVAHRPQPFMAVTDEHGLATLSNVPSFTERLGADHPQFEIPLQPSQFIRASPRRDLPLSLTPGQTAEVEISVQPKGREFAGRAP